MLFRSDQYKLAISIPAAPGDYKTVFRASVDNGASYAYCEIDGLHPSLDATKAGKLTATAAPPPSVQYCNFQFASTTAGAPGDPLTLYGRVYQPGVTDAIGAGAGIAMQAGIGPSGSIDPSAYAWTNATYASDVDGLNAGDHANDEYRLVTSLPDRKSVV